MWEREMSGWRTGKRSSTLQGSVVVFLARPAHESAHCNVWLRYLIRVQLPSSLFHKYLRLISSSQVLISLPLAAAGDAWMDGLEQGSAFVIGGRGGFQMRGMSRGARW